MAWRNTWYGILLRILVGINGLLTGAALVLLGFLIATVNWKTGETDWDAPSVLVVISGLLVPIWFIVAAVSPAKLRFIVPALWTALVAVGLVFLLVAEWARSL